MNILCIAFADKDRELGEALAEIKSLKNSERLKEKAVEEVIYTDINPKFLFIPPSTKKFILLIASATALVLRGVKEMHMAVLPFCMFQYGGQYALH